MTLFDRLFRPHEGADDEGKCFLSCFRILNRLVPILHRMCSVGATLSLEVAAVPFEGADDPFRRAEDKIRLQK